MSEFIRNYVAYLAALDETPSAVLPAPIAIV
jgi:hypothetical protein